jgi:hypothetical protein
VSIEFTTTEEKRRLTATIVGEDNPRIVEVDGRSMDVVPEGHVLFFSNNDKPGVVADVAQAMLKGGVNIGSLALGRDAAGGTAQAAMHVDERLSDEMCAQLEALPNVNDVRMTSLPVCLGQQGSLTTFARPATRPHSPHFGSGPTKKFPGYDVSKIAHTTSGRSHRSKVGKALINESVEMQRRLLNVPDDYHIAILPGSNTGAFECAMWTMLGRFNHLFSVLSSITCLCFPWLSITLGSVKHYLPLPLLPNTYSLFIPWLVSHRTRLATKHSLTVYSFFFWSFLTILGAKPVSVLEFESFGKGWMTDIEQQLKLGNVTHHKAEYGEVVDFDAVDAKDSDVVFTWNGTCLCDV